jgi:hypothetical protein
MMRTMLSKVMVTAVAALGLTLGAAGAAQADPAGKYVYVCVGTDGSSYTMASGAELGSCKGSYLQKYINGAQVDTIALTTSGAIADPDALSLDCLVAIVGTGASAYGIVQTGGTGAGVAYVGPCARAPPGGPGGPDVRPAPVPEDQDRISPRGRPDAAAPRGRRARRGSRRPPPPRAARARRPRRGGPRRPPCRPPASARAGSGGGCGCRGRR